MVPFKEALQFVLENKINLLTKISKLSRERETLTTMKKDIESKLGRELERPGRRRSELVDKWQKDVERIEKEIQDIMNQINEIYTYESIDEVFEEVMKDVKNHQLETPSSDRGNIAGVNQTNIGISVIGDDGNINLKDSPFALHIGTVQMINHYGSKQGNGADGEAMA